MIVLNDEANCLIAASWPRIQRAVDSDRYVVDELPVALTIFVQKDVSVWDERWNGNRTGLRRISPMDER